jgi:hypothetical protein
MSLTLCSGWLTLTRGLTSVGVALMLLWLVVSFQCQWLRTRQQRYHCLFRLEEMLALACGKQNFAAFCTVYVILCASD